MRMRALAKVEPGAYFMRDSAKPPTKTRRPAAPLPPLPRL